MLFDELALTPDILDAATYSHPALCTHLLQNLKKTLLEEAFVRDLRDGGWRTYIHAHKDRWDKRGTELFRKLVQQRRLYPCEPALETDPDEDAAWCGEALASHGRRALTGVVTSAAEKERFRHEPLVASIEQLASSAWWAGRCSSASMRRTTQAYLTELSPLLRHANSIAFIDRYLNPSDEKYREFATLLMAIEGRSPAPRVELHRVVYNDPKDKRGPGLQHWVDRFECLSEVAAALGSHVDVFLWDDFHDRYIITDVGGVSLQNSLDVTSNPRSVVRWNRLDRAARDEVAGEFDENSVMHRLVHKFPIVG